MINPARNFLYFVRFWIFLMNAWFTFCFVFLLVSWIVLSFGILIDCDSVLLVDFIGDFYLLVVFDILSNFSFPSLNEFTKIVFCWFLYEILNLMLLYARFVLPMEKRIRLTINVTSFLIKTGKLYFFVMPIFQMDFNFGILFNYNYNYI